MDAPTLVVSDPPHGDVAVDVVSEVLGLDLAGTRLKVAFPAPEVLFATEAGEAAELSAALRGAGMGVAVMDGASLARVPWPSPVSSLAFDRDGLTARLHDRDVHLPYGAPVVGVYCKPPADFRARAQVDAAAAMSNGPGPAVAEAIEWMANLDLYYEDGGALRRISIVPDLADFSSLGALRRTTSGETMAAVVEQCQRRFPGLTLDRRLENVRPRQRFVMGETGFDVDQRKRYSYGTLLLCHVLDSIAPELRDVPQYELGSRLAYVLARQR